MSFKRQYSSYKKRGKVRRSWRKPRGIDSKQRKRKKSKGKHPRIGRRKAKKLRVIKEVIVRNVSEIKDNKIIRIAGTVGKKKRNEILKKAKELKAKVVNA